MGPKLMNCCRTERMGTKEYGEMLKTLHTVEDGRFQAKEATNWRIEGQKKKSTRKEYQRLVNEFKKRKVFWRKEACGTLREKKS